MRLEEEGIKVSKTSLCMLIKKYKATRMIADRIRPPVKSKKLELEHLCLIDEALDADNENRIFICTAIQVCLRIKERVYVCTHIHMQLFRVFSHVFMVTTK